MKKGMTNYVYVHMLAIDGLKGNYIGPKALVLFKGTRKSSQGPCPFYVIQNSVVALVTAIKDASEN